MSDETVVKVKGILKEMKPTGTKKARTGYTFFKQYMDGWVEPSDQWNDLCECESEVQADCTCGFAGATSDGDVLEALDGRSYWDLLDEAYPDDEDVHNGFRTALDEFAAKMGFQRHG